MVDVDPTLSLSAAAANALGEGRVGDPFSLLGPHADARSIIVRAFLPGAEAVAMVSQDNAAVLTELQPVQIPGLFAGRIPHETRYRLRISWPGGVIQETEDPYSYGLLLGDLDLHLIAEGTHRALGRCLGAHVISMDNVAGVRFAVWAPNAMRVSVVGEFNAWDGRRYAMRKRVEAGVWELFIPRLTWGSLYKYEILGSRGLLTLKADPVAWQAEKAPRTASVVADPTPLIWHDEAWLAERLVRQSPQSPLSIYEVHVGSWRRNSSFDHPPLSWDELGDQLIPYVQELGFTHIELLPIMAYPFGGSWGYQPLSLYAPQASHGDPQAFARFIDRCHVADVGVILDWVPAHFPTDPHGLARFDGTALYEHEDPREGFHQDWNTLIYNLGRNEVRSFLLSSALHWLKQYHVDGLRVDAVASLLYRDYSRRAGQWIPNHHGGRENLEAVAFLRQLNETVATEVPGVLMIAEESTAWPGVTHAMQNGGLGFSYKWNMGWMHDTLRYISRDPIYRSHEHDRLTFGLIYAFSERFILPLSHDEVVHGKGSLLTKMPGDQWQKCANLRAFYGFMWAHPGKKLLFMGGELAQKGEWNHDAELDWNDLSSPMNKGVQLLVRDLNRLYRMEPALHAWDDSAQGFFWLVGDDRDNSVIAFCRAPGNDASPLIAICNFTPVPRKVYRVGAPRPGLWRELINTDAAVYGGSNMGNGGQMTTTKTPSHGQPYSMEVTLPPLATLLLGR